MREIFSAHFKESTWPHVLTLRCEDDIKRKNDTCLYLFSAHTVAVLIFKYYNILIMTIDIDEHLSAHVPSSLLR